MADNAKRHKVGLGLIPQPAPPTNPLNGDMFSSDGSGSYATGLWEYKDSAWSQVGQGSKDLSIYAQFDAEDQNVADFTNVSTSATSPLNGDHSYTISTYTADFGSISMPERSKGKTNAFECHASIASGTTKFSIKDQASNVLAELDFSETSTTKINIPFYVSSSVTSVTLEISDESSAGALKLDDLIFSDDPFKIVDLSNSTDLQAYTPTFGAGFGTVTNDEFYYSTRGEHVYITGRFQCGTVSAASNAIISLPNGYTASSALSSNVVPFGYAYNTNTVAQLLSGAFQHSPNLDLVRSAGTSSTPVSGIFNNNEIFFVEAIIPVNELKNSFRNVLTVNESTLPAHNIDTSGQTISVGLDIVNFATTEYYPEGQFIQTPNTRWVAQRSGTISVSVGLAIAAYAGNDPFDLYLLKNGSVYKILQEKSARDVDGDNGSNHMQGTVHGIFVNKGDYLEVQIQNNSGGARTLSGSAASNWFSVMWDDVKPLSALVLPLTAFLKDYKTSGTNGGNFVSGALRTRDLTTVEGDTSIVSLSSNQMTLQPGQYDIEWSAPAYQVDDHQSALFNITTGLVESAGTSESAAAASNTKTRSFGSARVNISSATVYEIQHQCDTTAAIGFGRNTGYNFGPGTNDELYTIVKITKIR